MSKQHYQLPETGFLRLPDILRLYPVSKSTLWAQVKEGHFPKPVKLSARITAWSIESVREFLEARRDGEQSHD